MRAVGVGIEDMRTYHWAREELGWRPRPVETTIVESPSACATSACWRSGKPVRDEIRRAVDAALTEPGTGPAEAGG